jgi:hypothetical protein
VTIPAGGYHVTENKVQWTMGQQRTASGQLYLNVGPFYAGNRTQIGYSSGRVKLANALSLEPGLSINRVTLPYGDFTAKLVTSRLTYTITPMMFVSTLVQYNSSTSTVSTNARLRWEYRPGSEFFLVYTEGRDTLSSRAPTQGLQNRTFVVKVNRLVRF